MTDPAPAGPTIEDRCRAEDVVRGLSRLFATRGEVVLAEVPLPNGRRADLVAIDRRGMISIIEVKVARADLIADSKWPDYLDWADRFYWALSPALDASLLDGADRLPERCGLIIADRYDGAVVREAALVPLAAARRKAEHLRIGRLAMRRTMAWLDPALALLPGGEED